MLFTAALAPTSFMMAPATGKAATRSPAAQMLYGEPRPVQIIPSVLPADWANMGAECKRLEDAGVDRIQFDVMDGNVCSAHASDALPAPWSALWPDSPSAPAPQFVPNLTFGPELIAACRKYTKVGPPAGPRPPRRAAPGLLQTRR